MLQVLNTETQSLLVTFKKTLYLVLGLLLLTLCKYLFAG